MKKFSKKIFSILCAAMLLLLVFCAVACGGKPDGPDDNVGGDKPTTTDYVSQLHLDMSSNTKKLEVTVKNFVDGDTTHFDPPSGKTGEFEGGYIKARYMAVNTPESTGDIEKWGKTASNYTKEKLSNAQSIYVESDDNKWNHDTNDRYMLWIWYKPQGEAEYRNLNIELLQGGYGRGSKIDGTRYEEIAYKALLQAQDQKLVVWSKAKDPNYFGGEGAEVTLKYLRFHIQNYEQKPVRVEGIVTAKFNHTAYIEEYDEETGTYFGIAVYFGFKGGKILDILSVGNRVSVHGTVTEFNGTYQISGVSYNEVYPQLNTNTILLDEEVHDPVFSETSLTDLNTKDARPVIGTFEEKVEGEEEPKDVTLTLQYGEAVMDTAVTLKNLTIVDIYSTKDKNTHEPTGQLSITCKDESGKTIVLRTEPLKKEDGKTLYTEEEIEALGANGIASAKGIVDKYEGAYQVAIWNIDCLTFA